MSGSIINLQSHIIAQTAKMLKERELGEVEVRPLTHELGVSEEEIPSLVFVPNKNKKHIFVIEHKQTDARVLPDIYAANAEQYKLWLQQNNDRVAIEYGLSSNAKTIDGENNKIKTISSINSAEELVDAITSWVSEINK